MNIPPPQDFLTKIDTFSEKSVHRGVIWVRYCPARVPNKVNEKNDVVRGLPACTRARVPIFRRVKKHTPKHFMLRPVLTFCSTCWLKNIIFKRFTKVIKKTSKNSGAGEPLKLMGPKLANPQLLKSHNQIVYSIENYTPIVMTLQPGSQQPRHSVVFVDLQRRNLKFAGSI